MSTVTTDSTQADLLIANYDTSKIFIWNNRTKVVEYDNETYDTVTIAAGTVMGRVTTTGKVLPLESDAADGSQIPVGIAYNAHTVASGDGINMLICDSGDVAEEMVVFQNGTDTINTTVDSQRLRDRLQYLGVNLVPSTENTIQDNQ